MTVAREIPFGRPLLGSEEKAAVAEVLEGPMLVHGAKTKMFEAAFSKFVGGGHALSVNSCTAGLHLALLAIGVCDGDEVIVPAQTHVATAHSVEYCRATPIFIDAEPATGNLDISQIEEKITARTKAISIVHYLGMPVDMDALNIIARKHGLPIVEDAALAIGSRYKKVHAGLLGDVGCFSFYPVKHITTAEGGMLVTQRDDIAQDVARRRAFGMDRTVAERAIPGVYDVTILGPNYRMNELEAAIGLEQLKKIVGWLERRRRNYEVLSAGLREIGGVRQFLSSHGDFESSYYCLSMLLSDELSAKRASVMTRLKERGVGTSIYYPAAVPLMTYYRDKYGYAEGSFPVAEKISRTSIALPVGPHLDTNDMNFIIQEVKAAMRDA